MTERELSIPRIRRIASTTTGSGTEPCIILPNNCINSSLYSLASYQAIAAYLSPVDFQLFCWAELGECYKENRRDLRRGMCRLVLKETYIIRASCNTLRTKPFPARYWTGRGQTAGRKGIDPPPLVQTAAMHLGCLFGCYDNSSVEGTGCGEGSQADYGGGMGTRRHT